MMEKPTNGIKISPQQSVTMATVAHHANVSRFTVSRVLNNPDSVKPETKEKVYRAIREVGYIPDEGARSLRRQKSFTIGAIFDWDHDFWSLEILRKVEPLLVKEGFSIVAYPHGSLSGDINNCINALLSRRVAGIISLVKLDNDMLEQLSNRGITVMHWGSRNISLPKVYFATVDSLQGSSRIASYLSSLGHKNIAFLQRGILLPEDTFSAHFIESIKKIDPTSTVRIVKTSYNTMKDGFEAIRQIDFASPDRPTALVCRNDSLAVGAISALSQMGIMVPKEISIVGVNDDSMSEFVVPSLTTLRIPASTVAECMVETIINGINDSSQMPQFQRITPELVLRDSTGPIPDNPLAWKTR